jgi:hypothetical protein
MSFPKIKMPSLNRAIHNLEDAIITVSGPALAISGIIAGVDLVTGGNMLRSVGWLAMAWAICLLLTLDFQVLALGARAHRVYQSDSKSNGRKVFEVALALTVAIAISYVSIQMQSIIARSNAVTPALSIEQATLQMGINPIALIWERSSLVLVLIFLSGWFRDDTVAPTIDSQIAMPEVPAIDIKSEIDSAVSNAIEQAMHQFDIAIQDVKTTIIEEVTQHRLIAIPKEAPSKIASIPPQVVDSKLSIDRLAIVKDALIANPTITDPKLAEIASCSINTARKYKKIAKEA